jgi:hypothetical protein
MKPQTGNLLQIYPENPMYMLKQGVWKYSEGKILLLLQEWVDTVWYTIWKQVTKNGWEHNGQAAQLTQY